MHDAAPLLLGSVPCSGLVGAGLALGSGAIATALLGALATNRFLAARAAERSVASPDRLPSDARPDLVVVLGCPTRTRAGRPNRLLADRAIAAARAYHALSGPTGAHDPNAPRVLCSGDGRPGVDDEASALAARLVAEGVPSTAIELDRNARRTLDTLDYLAARHAHERILLVSQAFHLPRVLFLARARRLDAWGLAAPGPPPGWRNRRREDLGQWRALFDVALGGHGRTRNRRARSRG